jgi:hypothetical protein
MLFILMNQKYFDFKKTKADEIVLYAHKLKNGATRDASLYKICKSLSYLVICVVLADGQPERVLLHVPDGSEGQHRARRSYLDQY